MNIDLNKLAEELHEAAVEKGFWDVDMPVHKHVNKLRSELGEVTQADRVGIMFEVERDGAKPEGVIAELGDFVMMMLDWMEYSHEEAVGLIASEHASVERMRIILRGVNCALLVDTLYSAVEIIKSGSKASNEEFLGSLIVAVYGPVIWAEDLGYDLWEIIRQKMEYNRHSRPKLHGRLY